MLLCLRVMSEPFLNTCSFIEPNNKVLLLDPLAINVFSTGNKSSKFTSVLYKL